MRTNVVETERALPPCGFFPSLFYALLFFAFIYFIELLVLSRTHATRSMIYVRVRVVGTNGFRPRQKEREQEREGEQSVRLGDSV